MRNHFHCKAAQATLTTSADYLIRRSGEGRNNKKTA